MTVSFFRFDNQVVDIYLEVSLNLMGEHSVNKVLVGDTGVFEAERHDIVVIVALV